VIAGLQRFVRGWVSAGGAGGVYEVRARICGRSVGRFRQVWRLRRMSCPLKAPAKKAGSNFTSIYYFGREGGGLGLNTEAAAARRSGTDSNCRSRSVAGSLFGRIHISCSGSRHIAPCAPLSQSCSGPGLAAPNRAGFSGRYEKLLGISTTSAISVGPAVSNPFCSSKQAQTLSALQVEATVLKVKQSGDMTGSSECDV